jgi:hydrogenase maturation protein HypF
MKIHPIPSKIKQVVLALGAESDGNFCFFRNGKIYFSESFGNLLEEKNWQKYRLAVLKFLRENNVNPKIILSDLHPNFRTTALAKNLAKKYQARYIPVQHHIAHIFSAVGDKLLLNNTYELSDTAYGIAMDGTGFSFDEKIWGGEIFEIKKGTTPKRIGRLENQTLLGGELAIQEPARMLIGLLNKLFSTSVSTSPACGRGARGEGEENRKNKIYHFIKNYYSCNQFELLYHQLQQNFNCLETSSAGRVLDAVSLLLGFCKNERNYKHEPIEKLENNSGKPYRDLKPVIVFDEKENNHILLTTPLFEYLVKNIHRDTRRLAATAQLYLAEGFYEIVKIQSKNQRGADIFCAGGITNNKIISNYLKSKSVYLNKKIPRGDGGISLGQLFFFLLRK